MIPERFIRITLELHGQAGQSWLEDLPHFLDGYARRWGFELRPPFPNLSYNYVTPVVLTDGSPAVLKAGIVNPELLSEIAALDHYAGRGAIRLLAADPENGVFLLERLQPGRPLSHLNDDEAMTRIAAEVMRRLWRPPPAGGPFPTVGDWARGLARLRETFDGGSGPFPRDLVETAESLFTELLPSMTASVLLHGDLHHENILSAGREPWLVIDPKGLIGEPAYEVGALLRNPMPEVATWPDLERVQARRVALLSESLGFDQARIAAWGVAQAVLSAWWSFEDHGHGWEPALACARALLPRLP